MLLLLGLAVALVVPGLIAPVASELPAARTGPRPAASTVASTYVPNPFRSGMNASLALGQPGLGTRANGSGPANASQPAGLTFDAAGDLWVADSENARVLEYRPPFHNGMSASIALGQPNLTSNAAAVTQAGLSYPVDLAFSPSGDLWVVDYSSSRVLEYLPPFSTGMDASVVIGQSTFTSPTAATSPTGLYGPEAVAFTSSGALLVADTENNRVLEYLPPFTTGMAATLVLGQPSFTASGPGTSATALHWPYGLAVAPDGDLFVSDFYNNRTLAFAPPFSTGMAASLVLGQVGFTSSTGGTGTSGMTYPVGLAVDARGDLWVSDYYNNRTVEFRPPLSDGMAISVALGQPTTVARSGGLGPAHELFPEGVAVDAQGDLWVTDSWNNRTLEYVPPAYTLGFTESGLPTGASWTVTVDGSTVAGPSPEANFTFLNGTYSFAASGSDGYTASPASGTVAVNGSATTVDVFFTSKAAGIPFTEVVVAVAEGVAAVAMAATFVVLRRRGRPPASGREPADRTGTSSSETVGPPPGASP